MAKAGSDKNTKNKSKHNKLMGRKKNKERSDKLLREERLKALKQKINEAKKEDS